MGVHLVADMEVDKVADRVADKKTQKKNKLMYAQKRISAPLLKFTKNNIFEAKMPAWITF